MRCRCCAGRILAAAHCRRGRSRAHDVTAAAARRTCQPSVIQRSHGAASSRAGRPPASSPDSCRDRASQRRRDHQGKSTRSSLQTVAGKRAVITLAASGGKRNVTVWRPSVYPPVCLSQVKSTTRQVCCILCSYFGFICSPQNLLLLCYSIFDFIFPYLFVSGLSRALD